MFLFQFVVLTLNMTYGSLFYLKVAHFLFRRHHQQSHVCLGNMFHQIPKYTPGNLQSLFSHAYLKDHLKCLHNEVRGTYPTSNLTHLLLKFSKIKINLNFCSGIQDENQHSSSSGLKYVNIDIKVSANRITNPYARIVSRLN